MYLSYDNQRSMKLLNRWGKPSSGSRPPANLRQPGPDLPAPDDGPGAEVCRWTLATVESYRECQSRHLRLVEAWPGWVGLHFLSSHKRPIAGTQVRGH